MKPMSSIPLLLLLLLVPGLLPAQTVYESKGGQGKVYSDRPLPGGKAVELRPLTVIEPLPVAPGGAPAYGGSSAAEREEKAAASTYQSLAIVFPEAGGSVAANQATFEVRLAIDPPLRVGDGHAFSLRLDGRAVPGRYTATEMMIPPEFFGDVAPAGVQHHVLEAYVVDAGGQRLLAAPPVEFQTRFVTILQRPRGRPPLHPHFQPPPRAQPAAALPPSVLPPAKAPEREKLPAGAVPPMHRFGDR